MHTNRKEKLSLVAFTLSRALRREKMFVKIPSGLANMCAVYFLGIDFVEDIRQYEVIKIASAEERKTFARSHCEDISHEDQQN